MSDTFKVSDISYVAPRNTSKTPHFFVVFAFFCGETYWFVQ